MKTLLPLLAGVLSAGCINTDPAVFVVANIENESAKVQASSLVTALDGALTLRLHLGARASDSATVEVSAFQLMSADGNRLLHSPLSFETTAVFPFLVEQDATHRLDIQFSGDANQLPTAIGDDLCGGGSLRYRVVLEGSLRGSSFDVTSPAPVAVGGCSN